MAIPSRQIGWGAEENILWEISKQLEALTGVVSKIGVISTTTTTTTIAFTTTSTSTTSGPIPYAYTVCTGESIDTNSACLSGFGFGSVTAYATTDIISAVTKFYSDASLTTPLVRSGYADSYKLVSSPTLVYAAYISSAGDVNGAVAC